MEALFWDYSEDLALPSSTQQNSESTYASSRSLQLDSRSYSPASTSCYSSSSVSTASIPMFSPPAKIIKDDTNSYRLPRPRRLEESRETWQCHRCQRVPRHLLLMPHEHHLRRSSRTTPMTFRLPCPRRLEESRRH
jgi:hypothetical protein